MRSNRKKKIRLNLYYNCFNEGDKHLGFEMGGVLYCLTHSKCSTSVLIPNTEVHMKDKSDKMQFLKSALNQKAKFLNTTGMFINKQFVLQNLHLLKIRT